MVTRTTRLRWRRVFRRRQRQVEGIGVQAEETLERHFIKRLGRLVNVRRFVLGWVLFFVFLGGALVWQLRVLNDTFQSLQPVAGGTYVEGMIGDFTNANPLYASSLTDTTVSRLVFAGLLAYDADNNLTGDLAESWSVDKTNTTYTITLKPQLVWQDGQPVTAEDVAFTFQTAQNPDAQSPLFSSWNNVRITVVNDRTVQFTLPAPFAPFPHSLTTGIIPEHVLGSTNVSELRSSQFNTTQPVGAGPFAWDSVELVHSGKKYSQQRIGLKPFDRYYAGEPHLDSFVVRTYSEEKALLADFKDKTVNALVGFDEVPDELSQDEDVITYDHTLTAEVMAFFKTDSPLLKSAAIRQALVQSVRVPDVVATLGYPVPVATSPMLRGQLGYAPSIQQLSFNQKNANKLLDRAGWKRKTPDSIRSRSKKPLSLRLVAQSTPDSTKVSAALQKFWRGVGIDVQVSLVSETELQNAIRDRSYDILLYGVSVGADPDVFAYWHSTQSDLRSRSRLNFSDYASTTADEALAAGRSRLDPVLRAAKYKSFLETWRHDAPALALYQPRSLYITNTPVFGIDRTTINTAADRLDNVHQWMVRQERRPST